MISRALFSTTYAIIGLFLSSTAAADVVFGVFPRGPVAETYNDFKPLADRLEKELGEKVVLSVAKDFEAFWEGVKNKQFDLVHYNQYHYIKTQKEFGYKVIAVNEENGSKEVRGQLTVRKDSGIKTVADLKGKTILFGGDDKAMGSYVATTWILKKAGLQAGKDYTVKFAKNPPSAVIAAYNKAADAAGSGDVILTLKGVTSKVDATQLTALATSDAFIHLAWAVKGDFPDAKAKKIQDIMTSLHTSPDGKEILKSCRVSNFHKASDSDFAKVREITKFALGEDY